MTKQTLEQIAKEMRDMASAAFGNPATVRVTAKTLLEYAEAVEHHLQDDRSVSVVEP